MNVPQDQHPFNDILASKLVAYNANLARKLGGVKEAILFQYIAWWEKRSADGWATRTMADVEEDTAIPIYAQQAVRESLEDRGVMESKRGEGNRLSYRIVWPAVHELLELGSPVSEVPNGPFPQTPYPLNPLPSSPPANPKIHSANGQKADKPVRTNRPVDPDFRPSDRTHELVVAYPAITEADVELELPSFIAHHEAKANTYKDWDAAFRKWMLNVSKWRQRSGVSPVPSINTDKFTVTGTRRMSPDRRRQLERRAAKGDQNAVNELAHS